MNPGKVVRIAAREFASTALTKGFIIGALVIPAIVVAILPVIGLLAAAAQPPVETGTLIVLDRTARLMAPLSEQLSEESIRERRAEVGRRIGEAAEEVLGPMGQNIAGQAEGAAGRIKVPSITTEAAAPDADVEALKQRIRDQQAEGQSDLLGIVEIDANAVQAAEGEDLGGFQAFFRPRLTQETIGEIEESVRRVIREQRFEAAGIDEQRIARLRTVEQRDTQEVTATGERAEASALSFFLPAGMMLLLLIAVLTGGQYLLTTTIEEKSSRVVELLLSAVSPVELMTGKVLGQMGVGLALLIVYNSVGIAALVYFSLADLIRPETILLSLAFFVLAYFMFASLMAAIGSAVNDLREAQSLMTPVMLALFVPYLLFMPVIRSPNSTLSTVLSFLPPIGPFVMVMRLASTEPPPAWQVLVGLATAAVGAVVCVWFAAKVFRVGLLMFGKPPNLATLIRWVRMA